MRNISKLILKITFGLILVSMIGCDKDEEKLTLPSSTEFKAIQNAVLEGKKQKFTVESYKGYTTLTSAAGVNFSFDASAFTSGGKTVSGSIEIEFIEIFDKANMLLTNKPTMGLKPDGKKAVLISGGEFYINAKQGTTQLEANQSMSLLIPTTVTPDNEMTLWTGEIIDDILVWKEDTANAAGQGRNGVFAEGNNYYVNFGNFGWTNVDKFYSDSRPKTTIKVKAPEGFDNSNSNIYLSYDGEGSALAQLDTYADGVFSEHYGQIPIGLACHIIFVTEDDGQFKWAVQGVTILENMTYSFSSGDMTTGTKEQIEAAINAIQ